MTTINPKDIRFSIIHKHTFHQATLDDGTTVYRKKKIYVPEWKKFVECAPDDLEFIFENKRTNYVSYQCTCGAAAIVISPSVYKNLSSPVEGREMFICIEFMTNGKHIPRNFTK